MKNLMILWFAVIISLFIAGCSGSSSPKDVSSKFWQAIQERDMETAKSVATWDTVEYLKYLKAEKIHPERFELGDEMLGEKRAEVATVLYTSRVGKSGIKVPGLTVLVNTEKGWRVDVKKTMGSIVKHSMDNVFNQLNNLLQDGMNELDKSLSESMNELGNVIEEGARELKKELSKPLLPRQKNNQAVPSIQTPKGQQI